MIDLYGHVSRSHPKEELEDVKKAVIEGVEYGKDAEEVQKRWLLRRLFLLGVVILVLFLILVVLLRYL